MPQDSPEDLPGADSRKYRCQECTVLNVPFPTCSAFWMDRSQHIPEIDSINEAIDDKPEHWKLNQYQTLWRCFGDDNFLVRCFTDSVELYCFEKDFSPFKECQLYRKERDRRATERSNQRRRIADWGAQSWQCMKPAACFMYLRQIYSALGSDCSGFSSSTMFWRSFWAMATYFV
jgi:hypothetical protein